MHCSIVTISKTTVSIMKLSISMGCCHVLCHCGECSCSGCWFFINMLSFILMSVAFLNYNAECRNPECLYAECKIFYWYAEWHHAVCCYTECKIFYCCAECHHAESCRHYTECRYTEYCIYIWYADCHYTECHNPDYPVCPHAECSMLLIFWLPLCWLSLYWVPNCWVSLYWGPCVP